MSTMERPKLTVFTFVTGLLTLAVGLITIIVPAVAQMGREWLIASVLIASGVTSIGFAATALRQEVRVYAILLAASSIAAGLTVLLHPLDTFITFTTLMGIYFMIESGLMGGLGMSVRSNRTAALMIFAMGSVSLIMSALIWLRLAGSPLKVIVTLVGITFIARGVMYMILAILIKGQGPLAPDVVAPEVVAPEEGEPTGDALSNA